MRLPNSEFTDRPWRTHEFTSDFAVKDVWALPTPGGPDDFGRLVAQFVGAETEPDSIIYRTLVATRWKLGAVLGWDDSSAGVGKRVASVRDRLPADLRTVQGPSSKANPFASVFLSHDEWLGESANRTVHVLVHLGWVHDGSGGYYAQMTPLVKPNGAFGKAYMRLITPISRTLVYPAMFRAIGRAWESR